MSDVFISYSRLDREFTGRLRDALIAEAQEIWIDWESIPPSQAWWDEIKKGIARANNFVVVLSPHSMASPICQMEIEYARQLKKRIIPILHADYDREDSLVAITMRLAKPEEVTTRDIWGARQPHDVFDANDGELKHINYFFFGADADFAARFADLLAIIRTDYEHKELHTTLELRALEWDRRACDASFLLIDTELEQAQAWLAAAGDKQPPVTDLHRAYIAASAKRTRQLLNIQRTAVIGTAAAVLAFIFAAIAGGYGFRVSQQANAASTREAEANAQIAVAAATLTAVAERVREGEAQIEAMRLAALANDELAAGRPYLATLLALKSLNTTYTAQADALLMRSLPENALLGGRHLTYHTTALTQLAFNPAGVLFSQDYNGSTAAWDIETGDLLDTFSIDNSTFRADRLYLSPDERFILALRANGTIELIDAPSDTLIHTLEANAAAGDAAFSPDGDSVAIAVDYSITIYDTQTGEAVRTIRPANGDYLSAVAYSPDGDRLVFGDVSGILYRARADTEGEVERFSGHAGLVADIAYSPDGRSFVTAGSQSGLDMEDSNALVWDAATFRPVRTLSGHRTSLAFVLFSADGRYIVTADAFGEIIVWPAAPPEPVVVLNGGHFRVVETEFSPDGTAIFTVHEDGAVIQWDAVTFEVVREFEYERASLEGAALSPDGSQLAAFEFDGTLVFWDTAAGARREQPADGAGNGVGIRYSADGRAVTVTKLGGDELTFDVQTGQQLAAMPRSELGFAYAYSADEQRAVYVSGPLAFVVDTATRETVLTLKGHTDTVAGAAFSRDGRLIVTTGYDATAIVWDAQTGTRIRVLYGHSDTVTNAAFSPDNHRVVTGSWDAAARVWDVDYRDLISSVCDALRLTRDFSAFERRQFGMTNEAPTCPQFTM